MLNSYSQPVSGPGYFFRGVTCLSDPALRWFVIIPLLINIAVFSALFVFSWQQMGVLVAFLLSWLPDWLAFLEYLLWPLFFVSMLGVVFFTFTIVGGIVAGPFNGLLAEKVQTLRGTSALSELSVKALCILVPKSIAREFRKLGYYLPRALGLLLLSFIPVINLTSPFLWFLFNGWMMSIQYCDYAADNRDVSFSDMLEWLKQDRSLTYGFGMTVTLVLMVPFINLIVMPAAVVGATLLWEDRIETAR